MKRSMYRIFLRGLGAVLPAVLTLYVLYLLFDFVESLSRDFLEIFLSGRWYFPGLGSVVLVASIFLVGIITQVSVFEYFVQWAEKTIMKLPLVRLIYSSVKDFAHFFSEDGPQKFSKGVIVDIPGWEGSLLGFITSEEIPKVLEGGERLVAVYLPMSYQLGGYTVLLPSDRVRQIDMPNEEMMRYILTAGISGKREQVGVTM